MYKDVAMTSGYVLKVNIDLIRINKYIMVTDILKFDRHIGFISVNESYLFLT